MENGDSPPRIQPCPMTMATSITTSTPLTSNHFSSPTEEPKEVIGPTSTRMTKQIKPSPNSQNKLPNSPLTMNTANIWAQENPKSPRWDQRWKKSPMSRNWPNNKYSICSKPLTVCPCQPMLHCTYELYGRDHLVLQQQDKDYTSMTVTQRFKEKYTTFTHYSIKNMSWFVSLKNEHLFISIWYLFPALEVYLGGCEVLFKAVFLISFFSSRLFLYFLLRMHTEILVRMNSMEFSILGKFINEVPMIPFGEGRTKFNADWFHFPTL